MYFIATIIAKHLSHFTVKLLVCSIYRFINWMVYQPHKEIIVLQQQDDELNSISTGFIL